MSDPIGHDAIQGDLVHEVDGIAEADNPLPRVWLWGFLLTIVFAAGYWYWCESLEAIPGPLDQYIAARAAALDTGEEVTDDMLRDLTRDELSVKAGAGAFSKNCTRCHGPDAAGKIGPNLTDAYWIGGGAPTDIYQTIVHGRLGKGMPAWGLELGRPMCKQIAAYVLTLRNTNRPGKAPQGEKWEPPDSPAH